MPTIYGSLYNDNARGARYRCLEDGGSDRWMYVRAVAPLVYVFLEIIDLPAYCGRDANARWAADVSVVDLTSLDPATVASALESCGAAEHIGDNPDPLWIASCCRDYGARSPVWDDTAGPVGDPDDRRSEDKHFYRLRAAARREADALSDTDYRDTMLDTRIVNAIGQTAREYANGTTGLWSALRRIQEDPNATPAQRLVLRVYAQAETTLGGDKIPGDVRAEE